jgi:hypothetical protein
MGMGRASSLVKRHHPKHEKRPPTVVHRSTARRPRRRLESSTTARRSPTGRLLEKVRGGLLGRDPAGPFRPGPGSRLGGDDSLPALDVVERGVE